MQLNLARRQLRDILILAVYRYAFTIIIDFRFGKGEPSIKQGQDILTIVKSFLGFLDGSATISAIFSADSTVSELRQIRPDSQG